jgi:hypothetical protein
MKIAPNLILYGLINHLSPHHIYGEDVENTKESAWDSYHYLSEMAERNGLFTVVRPIRHNSRHYEVVCHPTEHWWIALESAKYGVWWCSDSKAPDIFISINNMRQRKDLFILMDAPTRLQFARDWHDTYGDIPELQELITDLTLEVLDD